MIISGKAQVKQYGMLLNEQAISRIDKLRDMEIVLQNILLLLLHLRWSHMHICRTQLP